MITSTTATVIVIIIIIMAFAFIRYFNRAPEAVCYPGVIKYVMSPAYGTVIDIVESESQYTIKIMLTIFDVHAQYAPITGVITKLDHVQGNHCAINTENVRRGKTLDNEHLTYEIDSPEQIIYVRQIAGKFARRCVSFYPVGVVVHQCEIIGRILFGSQVDIIMDKFRNELMCEVGDYVRGGITHIAIARDDFKN